MGRLHVYVRPYPAGATAGGQYQVSTTPGSLFPIWSPNGKEIFYETNGRIMVAEYAVRGDSFTPGKPRQWCEAPLYVMGPFRNLDLAPDGKRFVVFPLASAASTERAALHLTFVLNFFDELRRRVPTK